MSSVNKVIIVGRLGNDPEVRQFNNGGGVTNISVATSEQWTDKQTGERREQTEWHRISLFNRLGEIAAQYLRKGSMVYIEGSLHTRKYTDNQGIERYTTEIRANEMRMLGGGNTNQGGYANNGNNQSFGQNDYNQNNNQAYQGGYNQGYNNPNNRPPSQNYNQNSSANQAYQAPLQQGNQPNPEPSYQASQGNHGNQNSFGNPDVLQAPKSAGTQPSSNVADDDIPF